MITRTAEVAVIVGDRRNAAPAAALVNPRLYLLDDNKARALPPRTTFDVAEAHRLNRAGYGVFWSPNVPLGAIRRIGHVTAPRFAFVELDAGDKPSQLARIDASPVPPSRVVETRRGHHLYWRVTDWTLAEWDAVVRHRLAPFFDADRNATDVVRLLRVPGFLHQKNPADPFGVRVVRSRDTRTSAAEMLAAFPEVLPPARPAYVPRVLETRDSDDILAAVGDLDARVALERVSGSPIVRCEHFTFRPTARGRWNICCDGKPCPCFVDERGRIGGGDGTASPTAITWIAWYYGGKPTTSDWRVIAAELRERFPELVKERRRHAA